MDKKKGELKVMKINKSFDLIFLNHHKQKILSIKVKLNSIINIMYPY